MKDRIEELAEQFGLSRNAYIAIRNEALELAARECDQKAESWAASVAEGSEQEAYEISVLNDCAAAIRKMKVSE